MVSELMRTNTSRAYRGIAIVVRCSRLTATIKVVVVVFVNCFLYLFC